MYALEPNTLSKDTEETLINRSQDFFNKTSLTWQQEEKDNYFVASKLQEAIESLLADNYPLLLIMKGLFGVWVYCFALALKTTEEKIYGTKNWRTIDRLFDKVITTILAKLKELPTVEFSQEIQEIIDNTNTWKRATNFTQNKNRESFEAQVKNVNMKFNQCINEFIKNKSATPLLVAHIGLLTLMQLHINFFDKKESSELYFKIPRYSVEIMSTAESVLLSFTSKKIMSKAKKSERGKIKIKRNLH